MKILKKGGVKEKEYRKKCGKCDTKFSYTSADIPSDWRDGDYVICPVCGQFISHAGLPQNIDRSKDC